MHYDLLSIGLKPRLIGTTRFGWDDFSIWVKFMPPTGQLFQAIRGPQWSSELHFLANILDTLVSANWQRGGGKGPRPKPVQRPGLSKDAQKFGKAAPLDDVRSHLMRLNGRAPGG